MRFSRGRPGVASWAEVAQFVREGMSRTPSPTIADVVRCVPPIWLDPHDRGLDRPKPQSVQRWITALKNLERIEDDTALEYVEDVKKLRQAPVSAVELICRWHKYDGLAALDAAAKVVRGEWRVEALRAEEAKARKHTMTKGSGRQYAHRLRQRVTDWAIERFRADYTVVQDRNTDDPPVDVLFVSKNGPKQFASALIFGPYTNPAEYDVRRTAFLSMLGGVALNMQKVLAIMPNQNPGYWRWLHDHNVRGANIELFAVSYDGRDFLPIKFQPSNSPVTPK
jgi:hypothetical protein